METDKRVLAELIAQAEDEWTPRLGVGRCYYVATRLIEAGIAYARQP